MSWRRQENSDSEQPKVDMSPMIDMVFLLLLFFLINAVIIETKMDVNVEVSVADQAIKAEDIQGRIVVNVYPEGKFFNAEGEELDENELFAYLSREREKNRKKGIPSSLLLRADKNVVFRETKKVIRIASNVGIEEMINAAFVVGP